MWVCVQVSSDTFEFTILICTGYNNHGKSLYLQLCTHKCAGYRILLHSPARSVPMVADFPEEAAVLAEGVAKMAPQALMTDDVFVPAWLWLPPLLLATLTVLLLVCCQRVLICKSSRHATCMSAEPPFN